MRKPQNYRTPERPSLMHSRPASVRTWVRRSPTPTRADMPGRGGAVRMAMPGDVLVCTVHDMPWHDMTFAATAATAPGTAGLAQLSADRLISWAFCRNPWDGVTSKTTIQAVGKRGRRPLEKVCKNPIWEGPQQCAGVRVFGRLLERNSHLHRRLGLAYMTCRPIGTNSCLGTGVVRN